VKSSVLSNFGHPVNLNSQNHPMSSAITNHLEVSSKATLCPIVLACDDSYGMPLATALRSMVEANRHAWPIQCYVLSDGVGEKTKRKVLASLPPDSVVIHWMPVELSAFAQFSTISHISKITYARFVITQIIPSHVSRALYLDSDLLVLDDLGPLCQTDLGDGVFGAVVDSFMDQATKQNRPGYERVPRVQNYFNAGVLLIDLKRA
jgi:lipopolysaccharide biosynthesis glycosyltransferase